MRFVVSNAVLNKSITFQNLLDSIGVAITAILGYDLFDQVRIAAVEVWAVPALGTAATVVVQYNGAQAVGLAGDGHVHSDTSMGIEPAHVLARPSILSAASLWQFNNTNIAFSLTAPAGAVVDVILSFRVISVAPPTALQNALVGATIGDIFYRGLDGLAVAGTALPAQAPITL